MLFTATQTHARLIIAIALMASGTFLLRSAPAQSDDEALVAKARQLHAAIFTIDTHCDTPLRMQDAAFDIGLQHSGGGRAAGKIDLPRMANGNLDAEFFALFVAQRERTAENYQWAQQQIDSLLALVTRMCQKYPNLIRLATTPAQGYENEKNGLLTAYLGMENGFPVAKDLSRIQYYYDSGIRYITLCHSFNNDICDSSTDPKGAEHHGLSAFGEQAVAEMNRLGMLIDVSHASDESFYDVLATSRLPVIASHSCARALCDHPRNISDEMLKALVAHGGVIQMCVFSDYVKKMPVNPAREAALKALEVRYGTWDSIRDDETLAKVRKEFYAINDTYPRPRATVADVVDHIDHVAQLVGIDHIGIGTDFDGGGGVIGCDDVSEMVNITLELADRGYSEQDIEKIWGGNFMRVFAQMSSDRAFQAAQ